MKLPELPDHITLAQIKSVLEILGVADEVTQKQLANVSIGGDAVVFEIYALKDGTRYYHWDRERIARHSICIPIEIEQVPATGESAQDRSGPEAIPFF